MGSLKRPKGMSVSRLVYFFRRCTPNSSFDVLRASFFSPLNNFLVNLNRFSFLLPLLPCVFCSCSDKDPFLYFEHLPLHQFPIIWHFHKLLLMKPLFYSKPAVLFLSSIACSYSFSFLFVCSSKVIKAHCMYNFSERMPFHSPRSFQAVSEN